jgi:FkbM family methyltransferase
MPGFTSSIYKGFIKIYKIIPLKKLLCLAIRKSKLPKEKFYREFKFNAGFKVPIDRKHSFYMFHHGGTIENEIFWFGLFKTFDNETSLIWQQLSKTSDIVFDLGANTGVYSLVTQCINPNATVYAFEPSINTFWKLQLNNKINGFNIKCEQLALSDSNGDKIFYDSQNVNQTSASLSPAKIKDKNTDKVILKEYNVKAITLADYIETNNIKKIDLMKIDIEMHEPEALEGFGKYLSLFKPVILIEVLTTEVADKLNKLIGDDFILLHLADENKVELMPQFKAIPEKWNYLCFHKDLENKIRQQTTLDW